MRILANDGISNAGKSKLESHGFEVVTDKVDQENLAQGINEGNFVGVLVRSATKVRQNHIDECPNLKLIGRGGVGMDNIDVQYARDKGLHVINTPSASSQSVAELAFSSLFSMARFTYDAARKMPSNGVSEFKSLKKSYSKGTELRGKTLAIIGFGGIGKELAKYALGAGMKVMYTNRESNTSETLPLDIAGNTVSVELERSSLEDCLKQADYISIHVPKQADGNAVIGAQEIELMKDGVGIVNTSRGGSIDEDALMKGLESNRIKAAALDVFVNEPTPREDVLKHPRIIATPHIGGSTVEAQDRIGLELADQIIKILQD